MNVEEFIICDLNNKNRKPKSDKLNSLSAKFSEIMAIDEFQLVQEPIENYYDVTELELKLRKFINEEGMKIMVSDDEASEAFISAPSGYVEIILPRSDLYETSEFRICTLAHELGHYMDYKHNFNFDSNAYAKQSESDEDNIITETIAWAYAEDILKVLGYKKWNFFDEIAIWSLTSYTGNVYHAYKNIKNLSYFKAKRHTTQKEYSL